ncbi:MAG: leucine-rich repeat domain-containing protein [Planctomycetaceae bacterium]
MVVLTRFVRSAVFVLSLTLCAPGCQDLGIPSPSDSTTDALEVEQNADQTPAAPPAIGSPPASSLTNQEPLTPEVIVSQFKAKQPHERTDADLAALANFEPETRMLEELNLRSAQITKAGLQSLAAFNELRRLDLTNCPVLTDDYQPLASLSQITWLSLSGAGVNSQSLSYLSPCTELTHLDLSNTQITDDGFVHLATLTKLEEINVSGCRIEGSGFAALGPRGARSQLKVIEASNTRFGYYGFTHLDGQRSLEVVSAGGCQAGDVVIQALKGASRIRVLNLSGNQVSDQGLRLLSGMKQLEQLNLANCTGVSDETLGRLRSHKELKVLRIENSACTQAGADEFKKAHPDCEVTFAGTSF